MFVSVTKDELTILEPDSEDAFVREKESLLSDDVRAWPNWKQVTNWTSPKDNWKEGAPPRSIPSLLASQKRWGHEILKGDTTQNHIPAQNQNPAQNHNPARNQNPVQMVPPASREISVESLKSSSSLNRHTWRPHSAPNPSVVWPQIQQDTKPTLATQNGQSPTKVKTQTGTESKKRPVLRRLVKLAAVFLLIAICGAGGYAYNFTAKQRSLLPALPENPAALLPVSSVILAADGSELGPVFGERRTWVDFENIAPVVIQALLAAEDHRFYEHSGVDYKRLVGAAWNTFQGSPEGASTITMQLSRNYFPSLKQTSLAERKVQELLLARRINQTYSKDETLELYLNTVSFGSNSFGIEAASKRYFSTTASELTLSQASLLVGMLKGPTRYNPFSQPSAAKERRNLVIERMRTLGLISQTVASEALAAPLGLHPSIFDPTDSIAPHFVDYVRKEAERWASQSGYDLKKDGLTIRTSLDPTLQSIALQSVSRKSDDLQNIVQGEFGREGSRTNASFWRSRTAVESDLLRKTTAYTVLIESGNSDTEALKALRSDAFFVNEIRAAATQLEAGLVAIDPHTGRVKAWVGGRDYAKDQFDKVGSAMRQPGSVFKPFLYAAALEAGYSPYYLVEDRLKTFSTDTRGEYWTPTNAGGGASGRLVTLRQGLAWSKNTVSAHLVARLGAQKVIDLANKMGVTSPLLPVPSIALGTSETTLLEMVHAYATFADYGVHRNLTVITSVEDRFGNVVATFGSQPEKVLNPETAYTMIDMLRDVVDGGTGSGIRNQFGVSGDIAGKTGTTQNNADGWFIAMHPDLVVGSWVGFNDQRLSFLSNYWGQGGHNALLLVGDFLRVVTKGSSPLLKNSRFTPPPGYRYPVKPVYSKPQPTEKKEEVEPAVVAPLRRLTLIRSSPLPLGTTHSNNEW